MVFKQTYQLKKIHKYCLYIQPQLYSFLKKRLQQNPFFLEYLIQNYKPALLENKHKTTLESATCKYQPKTKDYQRILLRNISPHLWKTLKELKRLTGYSISYIIRVFLEWEMLKQNQNIHSLLPLRQPLNQNDYHPSTSHINNYKLCEMWDDRNREISSIFEDFP